MALCAVSRNQRDEKESRRVKIHIPTPLRQFAAKQATVTVSAATVGEALDELTSTHPELKKHLYSEEGKLRAFVNIYLNDEDIRYLSEKENTAVKDSDSLSIIPSIAGGCGALNK
jgi:adenylyltransferase/sulfurtransferase